MLNNLLTLVHIKMNNMLVQFKTVISDSKELHEKQYKDDGNFDNENDYVSEYVINIKAVKSFRRGKVYLNGQPNECVYIYDKYGEQFTACLLITYTLFLSLYKQYVNEDILIMNQI